MALATTVLGLVVAIPALVAYNYLKNEIKDFEEDMHLFSNKLIATLEMQYRKVEGCEKKRDF
jgi:biopolymer transport protein TolQ